VGERNWHLSPEAEILPGLAEVAVTQIGVGPCLDILIINGYFLRKRGQKTLGGNMDPLGPKALAMLSLGKSSLLNVTWKGVATLPKIPPTWHHMGCCYPWG